MVTMILPGDADRMSLASPARMSGSRVFLFVVSAVVAGIVVFAVLWTQVISPSKPFQRETTTVDTSGLASYWDTTFKAAGWYGVTTMPEWDGTFLSAKTTAEQDAVTICGALSSWWVTSNQKFQSVRVVSPSGVVLVSRHLESDQCTIRK